MLNPAVFPMTVICLMNENSFIVFGSVLYFVVFRCGEMSILETAVCLASGCVDVN